MKATNIKGMPVRADGAAESTGTVDDLILDFSTRSVVALFLTGAGATDYTLPVGDVQETSGDGIVARRDAEILPAGDTPAYTPYPTFNRIFNQEVLSDSGAVIGKVVDLEIDEESWQIREYDVVADVTRAFEQGARSIPAAQVKAGARSMIVMESGPASA